MTNGFGGFQKLLGSMAVVAKFGVSKECVRYVNRKPYQAGGGAALQVGGPGFLIEFPAIGQPRGQVAVG